MIVTVGCWQYIVITRKSEFLVFDFTRLATSERYFCPLYP